MAKDTATAAVRPEALAEELEVSGKQLRAYLRKEFPRNKEARGTNWDLTPAMVKSCREHFTSEDED